MKHKKALILVDIQNDFAPGGALAVPCGDEVVDVANKLMDINYFDLVVATQDWHPKEHNSFASRHLNKKNFDIIKLNNLEQVLWPDHCVQNTHGAEFLSQLNLSKIHKVIQKGTNLNVDSYSGFYDNDRITQTDLHEYLKNKKVNTVYIMGLATDYCVKYTALDSIRLGYQTHLIVDGCRGLGEESTLKAINELKANLVQLCQSTDFLSSN